MKKCLITTLAAAMCSLIMPAQTPAEIETLRADTRSEVCGNILPFWLKAAPAPDGGFCGTIDATGRGIADSPRGAIMGARILWTFSSAYRIYGLPEYRVMADRMQKYLTDRFIDPRYGGIYWTVDADGNPQSDVKQTYAAAYAIYGLSEHFRATGSRPSLDAAIGIYRTLEEKVRDHDRGGYTEAFCRDYSKREIRGVDGHSGPSKTMNTHIHVLEAYTNLYRAWPDPTLAADIRALIDILGSKLYNPDSGHLILFCDDSWNEMEHTDSYGHDIETSWLLTEAAEILGDESLIAEVNSQALKMVDTALAEGMLPDGGMIYEKNSRHTDTHLSWWPQCETVIGCINAWQISGDSKYFRQAEKTWKLIKDKFVDTAHGGWHKNLHPDGTPYQGEPKGNIWNCPYHNSRVAFELNSRMLPRTASTEVMAWSNITGIRLDGQPVEFETALCAGSLDGMPEKTGRERQQNVRYRREGSRQIVNIPLHSATFEQRVTDAGPNTVRLAVTATADTTIAGEGAYFSIAFGPKFKDAKYKISSKKISMKAPEQALTLKLDRAAKTKLRTEDDATVIYITLLPTLKKGQSATLNATITAECSPQESDATISLDMSRPGARFAGFGGNFRLQNPRHDPAVIDYCLDNMRVAFGRVEFPWRSWDAGGAEDNHVRQSVEMARRLKAIGMPLVVSCWFPPQWALAPGSKRKSRGVAALRLDPAKTDSIYASLASYLVYLRDTHGVEADYFSFNESDIGIDVLFTPEEHRDFIKGFGARLASLNLPCRILLGDNSDATTTAFIEPALRDESCHKYIGAVSFHSWRGCDDATLRWWRDAASSINVPLLVGEGSTDAAAHRYPQIFNEATFALYEINLYTRLCAICQPVSILQWQLTSDYSPLQGQGMLGDKGPLRPTQRFYNLAQLAMTPADALAIPVTCDKENINTAAMSNIARGLTAVHIVNNGAARTATVTGLPDKAGHATAYITNEHMRSEAVALELNGDRCTISMPPASFCTLIIDQSPN